MHNIRILVLFVLLITLSCFRMEAQEAILPSGAEIIGLGGSVSYSIGQLDYINFSSDVGLVSLGVQQPLVVKMVATNEPQERFNISVFPNPVDHAVNLKLDEVFLNTTNNNLSYHLYDISGKLLETKKINHVFTSISMEEISSGMYLLRVTVNNSEVRSFKIIKTN